MLSEKPVLKPCPFCSMCGKATVLIHGRGYVCETPSCPCDKEPAIAPHEATMTAREWTRWGVGFDGLMRPQKDGGWLERFAVIRDREADQSIIAGLTQERDALRVALEPALKMLNSISVEPVTGRYCGHKANHGHPIDWVLTRDAQSVAENLSMRDCGFLSACANAIQAARAALAGNPEAKLKQLRNGEDVPADDLKEEK